MSSIYSFKVAPSELGQLMGTIAAMASICNILGPILASYIYHYTLNLHGALSDDYPYLLAAVMTLSCIPLRYKGFSVGVIPAR